MIQENDNGLAEHPSNIVSVLRPFMTHLKRLSDLKKIRQRLDLLLNERSNFKLKRKNGDKANKNQQKRETGSFVIESEVLGREEDEGKIEPSQIVHAKASDCINDCERLTCLPDNLAALIQLQTLPIFIVSNEIGNFKQLSRLQLRGELTIRNLENTGRESSQLPAAIGKSQMSGNPWSSESKHPPAYSIEKCPRLEENCKKDTGKEWAKIAHIVHIYIGSPELRKDNNVASSSCL
ncbi:hypothetical protein V6N13_059289 [Hibiscus sabdariffa]